jgi:hypothetical protein
VHLSAADVLGCMTVSTAVMRLVYNLAAQSW